MTEMRVYDVRVTVERIEGPSVCGLEVGDFFEVDWLEQDNLVCCPDPDERLVMRIERLGERTLTAEELT